MRKNNERIEGRESKTLTQILKAIKYAVNIGWLLQGDFQLITTLFIFNLDSIFTIIYLFSNNKIK